VDTRSRANEREGSLLQRLVSTARAAGHVSRETLRSALHVPEVRDPFLCWCLDTNLVSAQHVRLAVHLGLPLESRSWHVPLIQTVDWSDLGGKLRDSGQFWHVWLERTFGSELACRGCAHLLEDLLLVSFEVYERWSHDPSRRFVLEAYQDLLAKGAISALPSEDPLEHSNRSYELALSAVAEGVEPKLQSLSSRASHLAVRLIRGENIRVADEVRFLIVDLIEDGLQDLLWRRTGEGAAVRVLTEGLIRP